MNTEMNSLSQRITDSIRQHVQVVEKMLQENKDEISKLCITALDSLTSGGKLVFMGNGGSAADSQHLAAEFVGRFIKDRIPLAAIALTTDTSILTCIGNDYGYEQVFARQVKALCRKGDVIIGISTSGNSANVIHAINEAKRMGITTVGLLGGTGGKLRDLVDLAVVVPANITARIQEAHILIGHILCEYCDEYFVRNT